jgi:hypothetical protein
MEVLGGIRGHSYTHIRVAPAGRRTWHVLHTPSGIDRAACAWCTQAYAGMGGALELAVLCYVCLLLLACC